MPSAYGTNSTDDLLASRFQAVASGKADPAPLAARLRTRAYLKSIVAEMKSPARLASLDARMPKRARARGKRGGFVAKPLST